MRLSPRSLDTLIDLVENRIACMQVVGREDVRELAGLHRCRNELVAYAAGGSTGPGAVPTVRRRGRPPKSAALLPH